MWKAGAEFKRWGNRWFLGRFSFHMYTCSVGCFYGVLMVVVHLEVWFLIAGGQCGQYVCGERERIETAKKEKSDCKRSGRIDSSR